jgi:hypothetical protein
MIPPGGVFSEWATPRIRSFDNTLQRGQGIALRSRTHQTVGNVVSGRRFLSSNPNLPRAYPSLPR